MPAADLELRSLDSYFGARSQKTIGEQKDRVRARATPRQREFLEDKSSHIAICAGRRGSKTYGLGLKLIESCLSRNWSTCYYLTERRDRARELMWDAHDTGIKRLNEDLGLGLQFNNTHLEARSPLTNGVIKVRGAETRSDIDKLRGEPGDVFVLDEVRNWENPLLLSMLIEEVIEPQLADHDGQIILASNPGRVLAGIFYEATKSGAVEGRPWLEREAWPTTDWLWSVHRWTAADNSAKPAIWAKFLEFKKRKGWDDDHPLWRREYLGEWVEDMADRVFRFSRMKNLYTPDPKTVHGLPEGHDWKFICGMDFGFVDDFALVVAATAPTHPNLYVCHAFRKPKMLAGPIAEHFRHVERQYGGFYAVVGDTGGFGKGIVEELAASHGLDVETAEKVNKLTFIEMFNGDLVDRRVLVRDDLEEMIVELETLQWANARRNKTIRGQKDHLSDALIYLWRRTLHHEGQVPSSVPVPDSPEWHIEETRKARELARRRPPGRPDGLDGSRKNARLDSGGLYMLGYSR